MDAYKDKPPPQEGGGGQRDSRGKLPAGMIIAAAPQPPVVLKQSENRWQQPQELEQELSEEEKKTAELYRHVVAILNKLTPLKFKTLVEEMMALNIDTPGRLEGVIDRIVEKAVGEPVFSVPYANMCQCLFMIKVTDVEGKEVSFCKLLLNRCQKEFEKEKEDEQALLEKLNQLEGLSEEERKVKREEIDEALGKNKRKMLGNIKFIGELFKLKLLTENIMHDCIFKLLRAGDEESLESLCKLLFTIGKELDSEKAKLRIEQYFDQIKKIIVGKKISSRVTFMLRDVVELRQNKWIPCREEHYNPKTIDQIHKEAQMGKMQEQRIAASLPVKVNKQKKGGGPGVGRDSRKPMSSDGWITTGKGGKSMSFDPDKLKTIGKRTNNEEISVGPSSRFGQWGRGSSAGLNSTSQEQEPHGNRYSALRDNEDILPSNKLYDPRKCSSTGARPSSDGSRGSDKRETKSDRDSALEAVRALTKPQNEKPQNEKQQLVQLNEHVKSGGKGINTMDVGSDSLVQQVAYLRHKLDDEHASYKRILQAYQDGQQRQAQLIQKLQAKVLQYKRKCGELETSMTEKIQEEESAKKKLQDATDSLREKEAKLKETEEEHGNDLENSLIQLEQEQQRCAGLQHVNNMLREQLDDATEANEQLTLEVLKRTGECEKLKEELESRDEEEHAYFANEHNRLMSLWQTLASFRRQFNEMKSATQRDLSVIRSEVNKSARTVQGACMDLDKNMRSLDTNLKLELEEERDKRVQVYVESEGPRGLLAFLEEDKEIEESG